ncbi:MAG: hypothetical protein C4583_12045 [Anaerolineaceae bacterium]|nr:MAG: hypothetical protein C4583_12045 [Anaerolineaceae bacterium]
MKQASFTSVTLKTTAIHTVTYFIVGVLSFIFLDYTAKYADPAVANYLRQTDHPLVMAGPFFQILRGFLFGIVFYALRENIFPHKRGWLTLWLALVIVGILSPFAAAPSSIEGMIYTVLPAWFHVVNFPEIFIQSGLLALLTHYWVNHPEKRWLNWLLGILTALVILLSLLGALSAFGVLPSAG